MKILDKMHKNVLLSVAYANCFDSVTDCKEQQNERTREFCCTNPAAFLQLVSKLGKLKQIRARNLRGVAILCPI